MSMVRISEHYFEMLKLWRTIWGATCGKHRFVCILYFSMFFFSFSDMWQWDLFDQVCTTFRRQIVNNPMQKLEKKKKDSVPVSLNPFCCWRALISTWIPTVLNVKCSDCYGKDRGSVLPVFARILITLTNRGHVFHFFVAFHVQCWDVSDARDEKNWTCVDSFPKEFRRKRPTTISSELCAIFDILQRSE